MYSRKFNQVEPLERKPQPDNAYLINGTLPDETLLHIASYLTNIKNLSSFSQTSWLTHSIFKQSLNESAYKLLAQAVIDNDRKTIKKLLDLNPAFVLFTPSKGIVIESQLTWQRFYLEDNALTIAAKRKQIEVLSLLLPYCDRINMMSDIDVQTARKNALSAWTFYEMRTNEQDKEKIIIPQHYADYAQYLINVFREDNFSNETLNETTKSALTFLFNLVRPKKAIKLDDDYLDTELLLLALYQAYENNFITFDEKLDQLDAFYVRVIGLIQSVLVPETGIILCDGLNAVMTAREEGIQYAISDLAQTYKLKDGESFYRSARDSHDGVGSTYFAGLHKAEALQHAGCTWSPATLFATQCLAKAIRFQHLMQLASLQSQHTSNHKRQRCVIS